MIQSRQRVGSGGVDYKYIQYVEGQRDTEYPMVINESDRGNAAQDYPFFGQTLV